jgi:RNA polymerase sigma factor (sigma-70 family)
VTLWKPHEDHAMVTRMGLVKSQLQRIKNLLRLRGVTREDAEDLVQEAMLRLHVYTRSGGEVRDPTGFVVRTAFNLAVDTHRRAHRDLYEVTRVEELNLIDIHPGPDEVLAAEERLHRMMEALDRASVRTREVFFMHRLQGLSHADIARRFGVTTSAIEKHIAAAVTILAMERQKE